MSITCKNLSHIYGEKTPFEYYALKNVNLDIQEGSFTAIIGQTGSGKSTFIQHINALLLPTDGQITIDKYTISSKEKPEKLKQLRKKSGLVFQFPEYQLFEETIEKDIIFGPMNFGTSEEEAKEIAKKVIKMVGLDETYLQKSPFDLSGGQKRRIAIAGILAMDPDILVLDEPTNHLDSQAISFLENYLKGYKNALIVVSHDRYFIDVVSNKIIEIENGKSHSYNCRYEEYSIQKRTQRAIDLKHYINQQKEIKKIQESIDTLKSFNREKSIKRAESKEKQLAKIERIDRPENLPSAITVQFTPAIESGYDVLKVNDLSMRYDQIVFEHCNLDIKKGERVAIVGENGVGKTTLFKALVGQLPIEHGKIRFGSHVEMAYYDQEHESLNYNKTIFDEISDCYPRMTNQEIRSTLAMFNFRGDDVFKDIAMLSGGERGRVVLTEVLLKQANFLILDEPTNHLDISSKEVLEEALRSFEGTILFISHDRYFINKIATRVIEVQKDQCLSNNGNYDDYLNQKTPVVETTQKVVTEAKQRQIIDKKTKNEKKKLERTIDS